MLQRKEKWKKSKNLSNLVMISMKKIRYMLSLTSNKRSRHTIYSYIQTYKHTHIFSYTCPSRQTYYFSSIFTCSLPSVYTYVIIINILRFTSTHTHTHTHFHSLLHNDLLELLIPYLSILTYSLTHFLFLLVYIYICMMIPVI